MSATADSQKRNSAPVASRTGSASASGSPRNSTAGTATTAAPGKATTDAAKQSTRIGPYIVGKTLGVGSTGRVKLGTHQETGQRVAIKIISKVALKKEKEEKAAKAAAAAAATATTNAASPTSNTSSTSPATAPPHPAATDAASSGNNTLHRKLEREISIMKLIQHPSILSLYDVYESQDELFLIMELVEGGELFDYLVQRGRLKEPEALNFFQQIIAGVDYCHKHLICHRDLKPENLLLDSSKNIKIADFGMASLQPTGKLLETSCGSPHYASPEIIRGLKYNGQAADVWSCGVILYALLCGNLPFDDENIRRLLQKVKTGIFNVPDSVPADAADLIRRCLVVDPLKRITIAEIEQHPWFRKRPYTWANTSGGPLRDPPTPESLRPLTLEDIKAGNIESDIVATLGLLGYGDEDTVLRALMTPEANYEKVFYWILCQRKSEALETEPEETTDATKARRRVSSHGSRGSMYAERAASIFGSLNGSSQQDLATGASITAATSAGHLDQPSSSSSAAVQAQQQLAPLSPTAERKRLAADAQKRRSYNKSPLSTIVIAPTPVAGSGTGAARPASSAAVLPDGQFTAELAQKAKEAALLALTGQRQSQQPQQQQPPVSPTQGTAPTTVATIHQPQPKRSSILSDVRKKLSFHTGGGDASYDSVAAKSMPTLPNIATSPPSSSSTVGSAADKKAASPQTAAGTASSEPPSPVATNAPAPKNGNNRKSGGASNGSTDISGRSSISVSSPSVVSSIGNVHGATSPAISTAPKRSWFANLFHFRPQAFTVSAPPDMSLGRAREMLEATLQAVNVQSQPSRDGISLKCKYVAEGTVSASGASNSSSLGTAPIATAAAPPQQQQPLVDTSNASVKFKITMNQSGDAEAHNSASSDVGGSEGKSTPTSTLHHSATPQLGGTADPATTTGTTNNTTTAHSGGSAIELVCTQQQGSLAAFHQFREKFHREWQQQVQRA